MTIWKNKSLQSILLYFLPCFLFYNPEIQAKNKKELPKTLSVSYLDQVIHRKKKLIAKKCFKNIASQEKGFIMIEVKIFHSGKTKARIVGTEIKTNDSLKCVLSILNRTLFKKFERGTMIRIYRFFVL